MDMFTASSDLDLSLNVGNIPVERSRSDKISFLRKLTRSLYGLQNGKNGLQRHSVRKIEPVMRAAVPVVRFVESHTSIECDVSMENMDGVLKSELLGLFSSIDPRFRQLCFLLKAWAKAHDVNDSKKGTLNSLSIILLAAFHLQVPLVLGPIYVVTEQIPCL
jgi:DNA polymerase sigma